MFLKNGLSFCFITHMRVFEHIRYNASPQAQLPFRSVDNSHSLLESYIVQALA
jgi:hypothetical protein